MTAAMTNDGIQKAMCDGDGGDGGDRSSPLLDDIFDIEEIGTEVLACLRPSELISLSSCCRRLRSQVEQNALQLFKRLVPLKFGFDDQFGIDDPSRIFLGTGCAHRRDEQPRALFVVQEGLFEFVFDLMSTLDLGYDCNSLVEARKALEGERSWSYPTFRGDDISVSMCYTAEASKSAAVNTIYRMVTSALDRRSYDYDMKTVPSIWEVDLLGEWARYLAIQKNVSLRTWDWECPYNSYRGRHGMGVRLVLDGLILEVSFDNSSGVHTKMVKTREPHESSSKFWQEGPCPCRECPSSVADGPG